MLSVAFDMKIAKEISLDNNDFINVEENIAQLRGLTDFEELLKN